MAIEPETYLTGEYTYASLAERIEKPVLTQRHPLPWYVVIAIAFVFTNVLMMSMTYLLYKGVGIWGINIPVGWGFAIINFVWWIGIGQAGTLISAILLLMHQQWRNSINRFAEAMTLFCVMCAGLFPLLHVGRPWVAYWMAPIPSTLGIWPQWRSPLIWDFFALNAYMLVSVLFWYVGLIPDFATLRDRATNYYARVLFGILAFGWRGSARHWQRFESAYLILAGLATPLVVLLHSIVSFDFAVSVLPEWHTTIYPPYFVAGAIYAGFAMLLMLVLPVRAWYGLKDLITMDHIDWMAKITLTTGLIVFYGYMVELFNGFYSGNPDEIRAMRVLMFGPYAPLYWALIVCNGVVPQLLWFRRWRRSVPVLFMICAIVSIGMWLERFVIVPVGLYHSYMRSTWGMYFPTVWDWTLFLGTLGFFVFAMFLFIRFLPMINLFEMKDLLHWRERRRIAAAGGAQTEAASPDVSRA